ncbi:hypothetical protein [Methanobrevibacter sp.]
MNVFNYKKRKMPSPEIAGKHGMYRNKTPQNKIRLDEFIGKYIANGKMNCVDLKKEFKGDVI